MLDQFTTPHVVKARCEPIHHLDRSIRRAQKQRSGIRGDRAGEDLLARLLARYGSIGPVDPQGYAAHLISLLIEYPEWAGSETQALIASARALRTEPAPHPAECACWICITEHRGEVEQWLTSWRARNNGRAA